MLPPFPTAHILIFEVVFMTPALRVAMFLLALAALFTCGAAAAGEPLRWQLRDQASSPGEAEFRVRDEQWDPQATAVIICDVWDYHHCRNAVKRLEEFGPRLNQVVRRARQLGALIIHAPSDCMPAYADHPARARAVAVPRAANLPPNIDQWCSLIPSERVARYPLDQSDGGEDDDPAEHAEWAAKLKSLGRNPAMPWRRQSDMIEIDGAVDFISDRGDEVWNILEARGIRHVILSGVHLNMCVLGRPFGLRRLVLGGREVVLMRDMTDTMYDPRSWPYLNHFTANDRVVDHVERYVCPTVTSDQLLGGKPFRFSADKRPHLVIVAAEEGYGTKETLPRFAAEHLGRDFRVSFVFGRAGDPHDLPGLEVLDEADLALLSIRRHVLKPEAMAIIRRFVKSGKPVLGLRTASHAFALAKQPPPPGYEAWPEFDVEVFGSHYEGHATTKSPATVRPAQQAADDRLLQGLAREPRNRPGGLYQFTALSAQAKLLLEADQDGVRQPVAWTFTRADGGRSFYTSLGERVDFTNPDFVRLLCNAAYGSAGLPAPAPIPSPSPRQSLQRHWSNVVVPGPLDAETQNALDGYQGPVWYRCVFRVPADWRNGPLELRLPAAGGDVGVWWNGTPLAQAAGARSNGPAREAYVVGHEIASAGDAVLIVVRYPSGTARGFTSAPSLAVGGRQTDVRLQGRWQFRVGDDPSWSNMPLPAKFGASTDIVIDPLLDEAVR